MLFIHAFIALCAQSTLVASISNLQTVIGEQEDLKVPGENPLYHCESPSTDILQISRVNISPNPPLRGQPLNITAYGVLNEEVVKGAYASLLVKFGIIKLLSTKIDICDKVKDVDKECPLKEGETSIMTTVELPQEIPPGTFTVQADVNTKEDVKITCLKAAVSFPVSLDFF